MHKIDRRKALTVVATAPVAIALGGALASGGGGQLAALVRRYFAEIEAFNAAAKYETDDESDARAEATFDITVRQIVGVPARSAEDAIAALDWITRDGGQCMIELGYGDYGRAAESLMNTVRGYLISTMASRGAS